MAKPITSNNGSQKSKPRRNAKPGGPKPPRQAAPPAAAEASAGLARLNALSSADAEAELTRCCGSVRWAKRVADQRPFNVPQDLYSAAERAWAHMGTFDRLEAFSRHPRIGDVESLRVKFPSTAAWAGAEQAGVKGASDKVLGELAELNKAYEEKFGHVFLVCAAGKTAAEMLKLVKERLPHEPQAELDIAAAEQAKITRLRLERLLTSS